MFDLPVATAPQMDFPAGACLALVAMPAQPQWQPYIDYAVRDLGVRSLLVKGGTCCEASQAIRRWREISPRPLLMLADAEYGTAMRFDDGRREPASRALGQRSLAETEEAFARIGRDLKEMGIDINLAPVADVWISERIPFLQARCFGSEPEHVAAHTAAAVRGLHRSDVGACLKHFPGHGGASADSHEELPHDHVQISTWRDFHRIPFARGLEEGPELVMVAHLQMPGLEPRGDPATFSASIIQDLLRTHLDFQGVVITDALNMRAILHRWDPPEAVLRALQAGNDLCLLCEDHLGPELYTRWLPEIIDRIELALKTGELDRRRWIESCQRVQALIDSRRLAGPATTHSGMPEQV
jgi:beta-glucosidase-like glycosyl hydrolase